MRAVLLIVAALIACRFLLPSSAVRQGIAQASHQGSVGGIMVGLLLCLPIIGMFLLVRGFVRWQRRFHHRMRSDGLFPGAGGR